MIGSRISITSVGCVLVLLVLCLLVFVPPAYDALTQKSPGTFDTTTNTINMVQPNGYPDRDQQYAEHVNVPNSEANKNNAEAHLYDAQADAVEVLSEADATKTVAEACQIHPYSEGCMPYQEPMSAGAVMVILLACLVIGVGIIGFFSQFKHREKA